MIRNLLNGEVRETVKSIFCLDSYVNIVLPTIASESHFFSADLFIQISEALKVLTDKEARVKFLF